MLEPFLASSHSGEGLLRGEIEFTVRTILRDSRDIVVY